MIVAPRLPSSWGATDRERAAAFPCDDLLDDPDDAMVRAVDVAASPAIAFRWLCQLRVAPYSYDLIDNWGRRSPRRLTPGLERLAIGQRVMTMFELVSFSPDAHITLRSTADLFGAVVVTYRVSPAPCGARIVAKLGVRYPRNLTGSILRRALPWGDLIMMRKQLRTLAACAARTAAGSG